MAVKIRLKRLGKIRSPHYRIVVADSRTKRDGRAIEEIGKYHPKNDPSFIEVNSERAQYWLSVGAQPTEAVVAILKRTGDWQQFSGDTSPSGIDPQPEKKNKTDRFNAALAEAGGESKSAAISKKAPKSEPAKSEPAKSEPAKSEPAKSESTESESTESKSTESKSTESKPAKSESTESEPAKSESTESESTKSEPAKSESTKTDPSDQASTDAEGTPEQAAEAAEAGVAAAGAEPA